jgi:hypothetical protein
MRALRGISHDAPLWRHFTPLRHASQVISAVAAAWLLLPLPVVAQQPPSNVDDVLFRVGERVLEWYARAQSIVSLETVSIQPLRSDLAPVEFPRRLQFELRVAWDPSTAADGALPEANVLRSLLSVNGRPPRERDEPGCMDPKAVSPEPLTMLLHEEQRKFAFRPAGSTRAGGRAALMVDYRGVAPGPPEVTWTKDCVSVSLPGRARGRIWIDAETYDVLRLDEHLGGQFDFPVPGEHQRRGASRSMTIERADTSIEFRRVTFTDPEETLVLPVAVNSLQIVRGNGIQRTRITRRFSEHRRFLADGRVVQ